VLALRALAGDGVRVTLVSPDPALAYGPAATVEVFAPAPARAYDLRAIAADLRVSYHHARLEAVSSQKRRGAWGPAPGCLTTRWCWRRVRAQRWAFPGR
jgi:hypothetical protein